MNIQDTIANFKANVAKYEEQRASFNNVLLGQGYIVGIVCGGNNVLTYNVKFESVGNGMKKVKDFLLEDPINCVRFDKETAAKVAACVKNGNGTVGEAIHITKALEMRIASFKESIAFLEEAQAA